jgi:hypothetical protein
MKESFISLTAPASWLPHALKDVVPGWNKEPQSGDVM